MTESPKEFVPVKKIAGEMLLYFYLLQRRDITKLTDAILPFQVRHFNKDRRGTGPLMENRERSILNIEELKDYSDSDLLNAFLYLDDEGLIETRDSKTNMGHTFINTRLTSPGIDIIEGIERGEEERTQFNVTFNFNLNNNITVDSLLKAELGSIFKASLI